MIDEDPSQVQHELFPLAPPAPSPEPVAPRPKARKPEPAARPVVEEAPDIEPVPEDEPIAEPEPAETAPVSTGSLPVPIYPLPVEIAAVAPPRRTVSLGIFVAGMSAMSLLLAVIALGVGIHASRARSQHPDIAGEDVVLARLAGVAAGVDPASVAVDAGHKRLQARAVRIPGAELSTYRALEERVQAQAPGWTVAIVPPIQPTPAIRFADGEDDPSAGAQRAVQTSVWAARRWGFATIGVPGLVEPRPRRPLLPQRRAQAVASLIDQLGLRATPLPSEGQSFRLHLPWPPQK